MFSTAQKPEAIAVKAPDNAVWLAHDTLYVRIDDLIQVDAPGNIFDGETGLFLFTKEMRMGVSCKDAIRIRTASNTRGAVPECEEGEYILYHTVFRD